MTDREQTRNLVESYSRAWMDAAPCDCTTETEAGTIRTAEFLDVAGGRITLSHWVVDATVLRGLPGR